MACASIVPGPFAITGGNLVDRSNPKYTSLNFSIQTALPDVEEVQLYRRMAPTALFDRLARHR